MNRPLCSLLIGAVVILGCGSSGTPVPDAASLDELDGGGTDRSCSSDGWCPVARPEGRWANAVWGSAPNDVWVTTYDGPMLHWDGTSWSSQPPETSGYFTGLWGSGPTDVWAVGRYGTIFRWTGTSWGAVGTANAVLDSIWGSGPDDIWAVGRQGHILHWDGTSWSSVTSGTSDELTSIWGSSSNDIWALGARELFLHRSMLDQ